MGVGIMKDNKNKWMLALVLLIILAGCGTSKSNNTDTPVSESETGAQVLKIAMDAQPPSLDPPATTATAARDTSRLIFESLVTTDSSYQPVPLLAESIEVDDNKTYIFNLRKGIKFHNGKEMTAEDVVASMDRWMEKSSVTGSVFDGATWEEADDYTVVLQLAEPSSLTLDTLASSKMAAGIMPKEIIESATAENGVTEYIGTGPFELIEWKQDQYLHYKKFADYQSVEGEPDGLAGKREALVDEIYIYFVSDSSTRLAGLQTGEYDFIYNVPYDNFEQLKNDSQLSEHLDVSAAAMVAYNKIKGLSANVKFREAINMALDIEEIMLAAFPNKDLFWLHSSYMDEAIKSWASDTGSEYHQVNNPEKAKELLAETDYNGEEFKILTTRDYEHLYNMAIVIQDQLKKIGINAVLEVYDWPTVTQLKDDTDVWDAYVISSSVVSTPPQLIALNPTWAGGVNDQKAIDLMREIEMAPTSEEAKELWEQLQLYAWEELLPVTVFGSFNSLFASTNELTGFTMHTGPIFWNTKIEK